MKELQQKCARFLESQRFDSLALSVVDFEKNDFEFFQLSPFGDEKLFFDIASLTKPLTVGVSYLAHSDIFDSSMMLLLNHQGGLPAWGRLSKDSWRKTILEYPIKKSETCYSDYSALRLMLELEKKLKHSLKEIVSPYWDSEVLFWKDLPYNSFSPITGMRDSKEIMGEVHDDNAYVIDQFCSHAGLFATVEGLSRTLLKMNENLSLLGTIEKEWSKIPNGQRFVLGWDRVLDSQKTLAGKGCGPVTFGHLGFTGVSMWIDAEKKRAIIFLTNATQKFWYDRMELNNFRREVGSIVWNQ